MHGDVSFTYPLIMRWFHKNDLITWNEQRSVGSYDENGNLKAIEGIARDITERILSEE